MHHRRGLRRLLKNDELTRRIEEDVETAPLDSRRRAMLVYAAKLTRTPGQMVREDLVPLRNAGFEDEDILAIAEVTAYYAFANRIANGLGVVLEDT